VPALQEGVTVRNLFSRRRLIGASATLLVLGIAALVYAAWTATGGGSGYAKAGNAQALTTTDVSASTTASLYPGADGNVLIKINNPNPYPVRVTDVTGNGTITADAGHSTCGSDAGHPTGVTFTNQTGQTIDVAANASTQTTLTNAAHMSNASDDSCQGATFTIPVSLSGHSNAP
jgi:hypothetical protein